MPIATHISVRRSRTFGFLFWLAVLLLGTGLLPAAAQGSRGDTLNVHIFFDNDSASLGEESGKLDFLATILLQQKQDVAVSMKGHASNKGSAEYNRRLIERRLKSVKEYLVGKGIAGERIHPIVNGGIDYQAREQKLARRVDLMAVLPLASQEGTAREDTSQEEVSREDIAGVDTSLEGTAQEDTVADNQDNPIPTPPHNL